MFAKNQSVLCTVLHGQTVFFCFSFVVVEKGSGTLPLAVLCRELADFGDC